jgi:hypothetical protein
MIYQQTLWKEVKDVVNSKILAKNNRFKNGSMDTTLIMTL